MKLKVQLYILSLWLLFGLLLINKLEIPYYFGDHWEYVGTWKLLVLNWIPAICIAGMVYGCYCYYKFNHKVMRSSRQGPWKIVEIENVSFENLGFLATYIVPLLCFDLDFHLDEKRNALMLLLVIIAIGAVYIKANLYYTNPSLALMNFRIYKITYECQGVSKNAIILCREKLNEGDILFARFIDENVYYTQKSN